jgi:hypothetical protein
VSKGCALGRGLGGLIPGDDHPDISGARDAPPLPEQLAAQVDALSTRLGVEVALNRAGDGSGALLIRFDDARELARVLRAILDE